LVTGYGQSRGRKKKERLKTRNHANDEKYKCELHCEINGEISISEFFLLRTAFLKAMERKWNFFTIKIELATKILIIILVNCSR
jgi:hypothetical protein